MTAIMIHPNAPYESAWVLQWEPDAETARVKAWQMAREHAKRYPESAQSFSVNGTHYRNSDFTH